MPLPTATAPAGNRNISLDDLMNEMSIDRQEFETPGSYMEPVPMPGDRDKIDPEAGEKVSAETARAAGEQIANLVTNGSGAICGFIGSEKAEKYKVSAAQERDLSASYAKVAAHYNIQGTNPIFAAILLTIIILAPYFKTAFKDREKIKELEEEQATQAAEQRSQRSAQIQLAADMAKIQEELKQRKETTPAHEPTKVE